MDNKELDNDNNNNNVVKNYYEFYKNKIILGPMVRIGTLPMRLLALEYGADLVFTEEIIDYKLIKCKRFENKLLGTIDFVDDTGTIIFRTCPLERDKVVLQIGTNDPERAVQAAKMVENDVAAIDINMGCPKSFSLKGGMGAALMDKPDLVEKIIKLLKLNINKPVSCKTRIFDDLGSTLKFYKTIEMAGADALTVHGRTKFERPRHKNRNDFIRSASDTLKLPIIANGDSSNINLYEDIKIFQRKTHSSSVMISRSAMKNCSIFDQKNFLDDLDDIIEKYLRLAILYDNNSINTKYCLQQILGSLQEYGKGKLLLSSYDLKSMSQIFEIEDYYNEIIDNRTKIMMMESNNNQEKESSDNKKEINSLVNNTINDNNQFDPQELQDRTIQLPVIFDRTIFDKNNIELPKTILNKWIYLNSNSNTNSNDPEYETRRIEKQFFSILKYKNKYYSTPYLEKNKKQAEQSATLVFLLKEDLIKNSNQLDVIRKTCFIDEQNQIPSLEINFEGKKYFIKVNRI